MAGPIIGGIGSIIGGVLSSRGAQQAGNTVAQSTGEAAQASLNMFNVVRQLMEPFVSLGYGATLPLAQATGTQEGGNPFTAPLTKPFAPSDLTSTPGYQFTLDQGLRATQNALTSTGLGRSGTAVKAATDYASNLANTTYNQQWGNTLAQNQQIYNMLAGLVQGGSGAAAGTGGAGIQSATQANAFNTAGANAIATGQINSANALGGGIAQASLLPLLAQRSG